MAAHQHAAGQAAPAASLLSRARCAPPIPKGHPTHERMMRCPCKNVLSAALSAPSERQAVGKKYQQFSIRIGPPLVLARYGLPVRRGPRLYAKLEPSKGSLGTLY